MREYRIKRGHKTDIGELINEYYGAKGKITEGIKFEVKGIGKIDMKQEDNYLIVDIEPPKEINGDYNIIKKWNDFLLNATGFNTKERKKEFGKVKKPKK